jgi:CelD/BcsL family acetyltransferase involved in cellulose biosynthesis
MPDGYDELPHFRRVATATGAGEPFAGEEAAARLGRAAAPEPQSTLTVEVVDRASALRRLPAELDDLGARALESNPFAESPVFIAALEHVDLDTPLHIACVRDEAGRLHGVFPLVLAPLRPGLNLLVLRNWTHRYCFLGTPLVDAARAAGVLSAIGRWIESPAAPAGGLHWTKLSWDGPFGALVRETFADPSWRMDVVAEQRALLVREPDMKASISTKHAKELRRLERRLSERGDLAYASIGPDEDWRPWFDDFLALEASGWKGAEGSAIRSRPQDAAFFRGLVREAHARGQLQLLRLEVAGRAVAMKLNLRTRDRSYALKIGYDEDFSQFSPGVLVELFNIRAFEQEPGDIRAMDSCAAENHPMINRLWSGRRQIAAATLVRRGLLLRAAVGLRPIGRWVRRAAKFRFGPGERTP